MVIKITANREPVEVIEAGDEDASTVTTVEMAPLLAYMELPNAKAILVAEHILSHAESFTQDHNCAVLLTELADAIREAYGKIEGTL